MNFIDPTRNFDRSSFLNPLGSKVDQFQMARHRCEKLISLEVPSDTRRAPLSRVHINNINKSWCARCAPRVSRRVDWYTIAPSINGVKRCARGVVAWHTWRFQSRSFSSRNAASVHLFPRRGFKAGEGNKFPSFFRSAIRYFQPVVYTEIPTTAILCLLSLSLFLSLD